MPSGRTQIIHETNISQLLSTLAGVSTITAASRIDGSRQQGCKILKCKAAMFFDGKTTDEGPLIVGIAAVSSGNISEAFVADPRRFEDPGLADDANRKVFPIWSIARRSVQSNSDTDDNMKMLEDIRMPTWTLTEEEALVWFIFNRSGSALTNGTTVRINAVFVTRWERD